MTKGKLALAALFILLSTMTGAWWRLQRVLLPKEASLREELVHDRDSGQVNLLLIGVDSNEGSHRSDTIAFVSVNLESKTVKLLSLPRDTRVQITGHGWQKLNHAYAYGGVKLLQETLVNYLGLPIHYYVVVNYDSFPRVVDLIGGLEINVEKRLYYVDRAGGLYIDIPKGPQRLDGQKALHYVRFRNDALGDIGRVRRQQIFMHALLEKIYSPEILPKLPQLIREAIAMVETNLPPSQALQLGSYLREGEKEAQLQFSTLPGHSAYISGISYWLGDLAATSSFLSSSSDLPPETSPDLVGAETEMNFTAAEIASIFTRPVAVLNGSGGKGLAGQGAEVLQKLGIDVSYSGNAKHFDYHYSQVHYPQTEGEEGRKRGTALATLAGIGPKLVRASDVTVVTLTLGHDYATIFERLRSQRLE
ncbi:LCP family protein [Aminithiophilus ramosus]|uniref:LCP family protein n=2 Tax=Synergistales TaxID=649776 RepID=A0A9Q7AAV9_9BACT|nr:LCP family protein [Aminithiophilus ramosus]QTX33555.1 LCP family protein [Aminithiophilus ramosus]QVL37409.1 LCP family protein [Synergistota bacterium]